MCLRVSCSWNSCPATAQSGILPLPGEAGGGEGRQHRHCDPAPQPEAAGGYDPAGQGAGEGGRSGPSPPAAASMPSSRRHWPTPLDIPVFTSSLLQVPLCTGTGGPVTEPWALSPPAPPACPKALAACGITRDAPHRHGSGERPEWSKKDRPSLMTASTWTLSPKIPRQGVKRSPEIGAITVLECTDLPPFARRIREELDIPVFDFNFHDRPCGHGPRPL